MPNRIWRLQFRDGHIVLRRFPEPLAKGQRLDMYGQTWVVHEMTDHTAVLTPAKAPPGDHRDDVMAEVTGQARL